MTTTPSETIASAPEEIDLAFPLSARAPSRARELCDRIVEWGALTKERAGDLRLLVSELVTNSVRHAGEGTIRIRALLADDRVRVEVHDDGPGVRQRRPGASVLDGSGRGLRLVEQLADHWGTTAD